MLKIKRLTPPPAFYDLIEKPRERLIHWAYRSRAERRQLRAPIEHDLFYAGEVVEMVASDFGGYCGYCEREIGTAEGITHYRPLSSPYSEHHGEYADHYSWLAYEWANLFSICRRCRRARADQFPVLGRRARFLATFDEVRAEEKPLLIDPTVDNPSSHLSYLMSGECFPRKNSLKGNATVNILALNDDDVVEERRNAFDETLRVWRRALEERRELPSDFLMLGAFRGARRDVLTRTLSEYGAESPSINNGSALLHMLRLLVENSDDDARRGMIRALDLVRESDKIRLSELELRTIYSSDHVLIEAAPYQRQAKLLAPNSDLFSFTVSNFRAIDKVKIDCPKGRPARSGAACLLLLGENAVGKSTCLSAVALALLGTREARRLKLPYGDLARSSSRESWDVWGRKPLEASVYLTDRKSPATFYYDPVRRHFDGTLDQTTVVLGYGPHRYFTNTRGRRGLGAAQRVRSLFEPQYPLPDPSDWLGSVHGFAFDEVARTVRTILPIGDDDYLVKDQRAGVCVWAQGQLTPIGRLSEGYRSVFAMVTDICRSLLDHWSNLETARGVVLIDEVETHLHPQWKMRVMSSLRRAFPNVQFIATTHDPLCVRGMDDGEVIVLTRNEDGGIELLKDLPAVSGMRAEQLLTSEYFGLASTIDPEIQLDIARLAEDVAVNPARAIGEEAEKLIANLTVGDSATAQVVQEALLRYLREREKPADKLSSNARPEAVAAVFNALRKSQAG